MIYLITFIVLFLIMGFAASQAGYSFGVSDDKYQKWQKQFPLGNRVPEFFVGLMFGGIALWGWDNKFNLVQRYVESFPITSVSLLFLVGMIFFVLLSLASFISFVGKESATVFYLPGNWRKGWNKDSDGDGDIDVDDLRKSTMRPVNDFFAKILNVSLTGGWYPKIWAFTKGLLISIPIGCLCAPFAPFCRHLGIVAGEYMRKNYNHTVNAYAEFIGDGLTYACGLTLFILLMT